MKKKIKEKNLSGLHKIRINRAGCLGRCTEGPLCVVYPEGIWYHVACLEDIDEIIEQHLIEGNYVSRLMLETKLKND